MSALDTYMAVSQTVGVWGTVAGMVGFALVLVYALWPRNAATFHHAAHMILEDDANGRPE